MTHPQRYSNLSIVICRHLAPAMTDDCGLSNMRGQRVSHAIVQGLNRAQRCYAAVRFRTVRNSVRCHYGHGSNIQFSSENSA
jgi:hypothetical protein